MTRSVGLLSVALAVAGTVAPTSGTLVLTQRQAYVMGTRVDLSTLAPDRAEGLKRLEAALDSLEATDAELSTWKPDSRISVINRSPIGQSQPLTPRLCKLLGELQDWQTATNGTFDPGIGALTDAWAIHGNGRTATPRELENARNHSGIWLFDVNQVRCSVVRREAATVDVGAFGKGEAIDRAGATLNDFPWMIDFGGQVSVGGTPRNGKAWSVRVADPVDRSRSIMSVQLRLGSLSTSAGAEHDLHVNGVRIGHILDPRTGVPAPYTGSVVVWHERALVADILSTALYVMGPREGKVWAESRGIAAAYLIPGRGGLQMVATTRFDALEPTTEPE